MTFVMWFFLLVIFFSSAELMLLIEVAARMGFATTFLLCVLTGIAGGTLVRIQGLSTLQQINRSLAQGRIPATEIVSGLILLIMGGLLLVPGFITDALGLILLIPPVRNWTARLLIKKFEVSVKTEQKMFYWGNKRDIQDGEGAIDVDFSTSNEPDVNENGGSHHN